MKRKKSRIRKAEGLQVGTRSQLFFQSFFVVVVDFHYPFIC